MADIDHQRHPGMAPAGFGVTFGLLLVVVLAYQTGALAGAGWAGGEYANTFVGIALASVVVGTVMVASGKHSRWRRFGVGVLVGGGLGIAFVLVAFAVVLYALSTLSS
jgi:hypothetical protein